MFRFELISILSIYVLSQCLPVCCFDSSYIVKLYWKIIFKDLPENATYKVTEQGTEYEPTYNLVSDGSSGAPVFVNQTGTTTAGNSLSTNTETVDRTDGTVTVKYTNTYNVNVKTGFFNKRNLPLIFMITLSLLALIFISVINIYGRKNKIERF